MTRRKPTDDGYDRLLQTVADRLQQPIDSEVVQHVTLLTLQRDALKLRLRHGEHVLTSDIVALDAALDKYIPRPGINLTVEFVGGSDEAAPGEASVSGCAKCRRCGWTPPNNDRVAQCYLCSWKVGADPNYEPRRPLIEVSSVQRSDPHTPPAQVNGDGAAPDGPSNVVALDTDARDALAAERRRLARFSNGIDPGPPKPASHHSYGRGIGGDSPSSLMRRIERDYT